MAERGKKKVTLAMFLKERRLAAGVPQRALAVKLGYTSPQFISNWERGLAKPPVFMLRNLGKFLQVPPDDLFQMYLAEVNAQLAKEYRSSINRYRALET